MVVGILVEKPTAYQNFIKALGGDKGIFNGEEYIIAHSVGHIYEYKNEKYQVDKSLERKYKSWDVKDLPWNYNDFSWKKKSVSGHTQTIQNIKDRLKNCSELVIATDIDPSGEGAVIAGEILLENKLIKKNTKISRMEFIDESSKSLQIAFKERVDVTSLVDFPEYKKGVVRAKWDFMSQQFSRVLTYYAPVRCTLRTGRLKGVIIEETGKALEALANYKEVFWYQNRFKDENGNVYIDPKQPQFPNENEVPNIYKPSKTQLDSKQLKYSAPPLLPDLSTITGHLSARGWSPKSILSTYQKMYLDDYLSYPRTDDKTIKPEQFKELLPHLDELADLVGVDKKEINYRKERKTHINVIGSHGANRPGTKIPKSLAQLEKKYGKLGVAIYTYLTKYYLAMCMSDYKYELHKGSLVDYPTFKTSVQVPLELGWKKLLSNLDEDFNEESSVGLGKNASPFIYKGQEPKPPVPTIKYINKLLLKYNIGTGATKSRIFTELSDTSHKFPLIEINRGKINLTTYGQMSYQLSKGTSMANPVITKQIQDVLKQIGEGNDSNTLNLLNDIENLVKHDIEIVKENSKNVTKPVFKKVEKETVKSETGEELSFKKSWGKYDFTDEEIEKLKNGEEIKIGPFKNKKKKEYYVKGKLGWGTFKGKKYYGFQAEFV